MDQLSSVSKTLRSSQGVLVNALPGQYEMQLWSLFEEHVPQPEEGSPRAILLCKDDQQARTIHAQFAQLAKAKDLTVDLIV